MTQTGTIDRSGPKNTQVFTPVDVSFDKRLDMSYDVNSIHTRP